MMFGILLGGALVRRFKPRPRILTGGLLFAESFGLLAILISMQISCQPPQTDSSFTNSLVNLENDCNRECFCTTKFYTPICGPDEKTTYFSPCHAGCSSHNTTSDDKEMFTDCKCVHDDDAAPVIGDAPRGYCSFECQWLVVYIIVLCLGRFMSSSTAVPNAIVFFRCLNPRDKSAAMGVVSFFHSALAFIPFPILYGALSDSCCLVWEHSCGKTGNCWIYDIDKFRYRLHGISALFCFLGSCMDLAVWYFSPRLKNLYSDEETSAEDKKDGIQNGKEAKDSENILLNDSSLPLELSCSRNISSDDPSSPLGLTGVRNALFENSDTDMGSMDSKKR